MFVVRNAASLVVGALNSLKQQSFKDFDVVVVDSASTDDTLKLLDEAAKELPLHVVSEPDRRLADAFAKGLRRATGIIVGMLCADERYYPSTLEQVVQWFDAEPDAVMCGGTGRLVPRAIRFTLNTQWDHETPIARTADRGSLRIFCTSHPGQSPYP